MVSVSLRNINNLSDILLSLQLPLEVKCSMSLNVPGRGKKKTVGEKLSPIAHGMILRAYFMAVVLGTAVHLWITHTGLGTPIPGKVSIYQYCSDLEYSFHISPVKNVSPAKLEVSNSECGVYDLDRTEASLLLPPVLSRQFLFCSWITKPAGDSHHLRTN